VVIIKRIRSAIPLGRLNTAKHFRHHNDNDNDDDDVNADIHP
jgi:hypothetical protein